MFPGVRLYQGVRNRTIPNYAMIAGRDFAARDGGTGGAGHLDGLNDGIWCQSAMNVTDIGSWNLPDGNAASDDLDFNPIHMANRRGQVGLLRSAGIGSSPYMGMYTCTIPDVNGVNHTLVTWAARNGAYDGTGGTREFTIFMHDLSLSFQFDKSRKVKSTLNLCSANTPAVNTSYILHDFPSLLTCKVHKKQRQLLKACIKHNGNKCMHLN